MSKEKNLGTGLIVGFLAGGIAGAVVALLYAPKAGKELRGDIKNKAEDYWHDAEKYIDEAKDKAVGLINEGKKKSDRIISDAKVKAEELLKDAEKLFGEAKTKATEYASTGKETVEKETGKIKSAVKAGMDAYKAEKEA